MAAPAASKTAEKLAKMRAALQLVLTERDAEIVALRRAGLSPAEVARRYGLGRQRVEQIVIEARLRDAEARR